MKLFVKTLAALAILLIFAALHGDSWPPSMQNYYQPQSTMSGSTTNTDNQIADRVREVLANAPDLSNDAKNIQVTVVDANVTLYGYVKSVWERNTVLRLVNNVGGVHRVDDQLQVKPQ